MALLVFQVYLHRSLGKIVYFFTTQYHNFVNPLGLCHIIWTNTAGWQNWR